METTDSFKRCHFANVRQGHLIALNDPAQDERIEQELRLSLAAAGWQQRRELSGPRRPLESRKRIEEEDVWGTLAEQVQACARRRGRAAAQSFGDAALPQARELLRHKKADVRAASVTLLSSVGTDAAALAELELRLDEESSDDVRDDILLAVAAAWAKQGRKVTRKDVEARIKKSADKLASPPATWADPAKLPPLYWKDGGKLSRDATAYLIYRQSRAQPDAG